MASKSYFELMYENYTNIEVLDKRTKYILDIQKQHREDIETLFRYNKYVTIYATIINLILVGLMICLILTN